MNKTLFNILVILTGMLILIVLLDQVRWQKVSSSELRATQQQDTLLQSLVENVRKKQKLNLLKKQILKRQVQRKIAIYEPIITKFSKRYGIDWRLIVAQILKESKFSEHSISYMGARGLMQIMPRTAKEISRELRLRGIRNDPQANIIGGIYHMSKQLKFFKDAEWNNRIRFALAAYNCGAGHIFDAKQICYYQHYDPNQWDFVKINLTKLKKENYQLHLQVWPSGRPKYGYFNDHKQTLNYVADIMDYYLMLKTIF